MMVRSMSSREDRTHRIPHPRPPLDPAHEPFVGNETADDNLAEAVEIAIWNALGAADHPLDIAVDNGVVTLAGELADQEQCEKCERAAASLGGVREVRSQLRSRQHAVVQRIVRPEPWTAEAEPLACVTRYCGISEASLSAAIRDGVATLDAALASYGIASPERLVLTYRNRRDDTLTLEIGLPVPRGAVLIPGLAGASPKGLMMSEVVGEGVAELLAGVDRLHAAARAAGHEPAQEFWQRLEAADFRPWRGHPPSTVNVAVTE